MRPIHRVNQIFPTVLLLAAIAVSAIAEEANTRGAVLERLEQQYLLTKTTDDLSDIETAGSILTLKKDDLMTVGLSSGSICPNTYKEGKITHGKFAAVTCHATAKRKVFLAGQKLWVTNIDVRNDGVVFDLYTDAYAGERYKATLLFPVPKGTIPRPEEMAAVVAEVFSAEPPPPAEGGDVAPPPPAPKAAPAPPSTPRAKPAPALPPIDAPPPPPPDPKTIGLGQTTQQVIAILGKPKTTEKSANKEIYHYPALTVTFVNNKVTDVQ
jgi:hypothetical protein